MSGKKDGNTKTENPGEDNKNDVLDNILKDSKDLEQIQPDTVKGNSPVDNKPKRNGMDSDDDNVQKDSSGSKADSGEKGLMDSKFDPDPNLPNSDADEIKANDQLDSVKSNKDTESISNDEEMAENANVKDVTGSKADDERERLTEGTFNPESILPNSDPDEIKANDQVKQINSNKDIERAQPTNEKDTIHTDAINKTKSNDNEMVENANTKDLTGPKADVVRESLTDSKFDPDSKLSISDSKDIKADDKVNQINRNTDRNTVAQPTKKNDTIHKDDKNKVNSNENEMAENTNVESDIQFGTKEISGTGMNLKLNSQPVKQTKDENRSGNLNNKTYVEVDDTKPSKTSTEQEKEKMKNTLETKKSDERVSDIFSKDNIQNPTITFDGTAVGKEITKENSSHFVKPKNENTQAEQADEFDRKTDRLNDLPERNTKTSESKPPSDNKDDNKDNLAKRNTSEVVRNTTLDIRKHLTGHNEQLLDSNRNASLQQTFEKSKNGSLTGLLKTPVNKTSDWFEKYHERYNNLTKAVLSDIRNVSLSIQNGTRNITGKSSELRQLLEKQSKANQGSNNSSFHVKSANATLTIPISKTSIVLKTNFRQQLTNGSVVQPNNKQNISRVVDQTQETKLVGRTRDTNIKNETGKNETREKKVFTLKKEGPLFENNTENATQNKGSNPLLSVQQNSDRLLSNTNIKMGLSQNKTSSKTASVLKNGISSNRLSTLFGRGKAPLKA